MNYGPAQLSVRTDHQKRSYESTASTAWEHQLRIISRLFKALVHAKCVLAISWYQRFGEARKKQQQEQ